jgi:hypothetical protein
VKEDTVKKSPRLAATSIGVGLLVLPLSACLDEDFNPNHVYIEDGETITVGPDEEEENSGCEDPSLC